MSECHAKCAWQTYRITDQLLRCVYRECSHRDDDENSINRAGLLDSPISENEIRKAVSCMKAGKSPGMDGFPVEYYKQYIDIFAPILKEVYNEAFTLGSLPPTFYNALISVIPKKDRDPTDTVDL